MLLLDDLKNIIYAYEIELNLDFIIYEMIKYLRAREYCFPNQHTNNLKVEE